MGAGILTAVATGIIPSLLKSFLDKGEDEVQAPEIPKAPVAEDVISPEQKSKDEAARIRDLKRRQGAKAPPKLVSLAGEEDLTRKTLLGE